MLSPNKKKFEHRIKTTIGQLRIVVKKAEENPADSYGQLHTIERSILQAKMFIIKDLIDQLYNAKSDDARRTAVAQLYDCLGFYRDELPAKKPEHND